MINTGGESPLADGIQRALIKQPFGIGFEYGNSDDAAISFDQKFNHHLAGGSQSARCRREFRIDFLNGNRRLIDLFQVEFTPPPSHP